MRYSVEELIIRLQQHPEVLAIANYGSRQVGKPGPGDIDLVVVVARKVRVESIHFFVGDTPVDLNLRSLSQLTAACPVSSIDHAFADAKVIYDPDGILQEANYSIRSWQKAPSVDVEFERFSKGHLLFKVKDRLDQNPLLCELLLGANVHWLLTAYFALRKLPFPGEKRALEYLREKEQAIHDLLEEFFREKDVHRKYQISKRLTEFVCAPVGGPWRQDEVLVLGLDGQKSGDLQNEGKAILNWLLTRDKSMG